MKPHKIKWALMGGGAGSLIGIVHRIAGALGDDYQLVGGVFNTDPVVSREFSSDLELDPSRSYENLDQFIAREHALPEAERVKLVTVATPNHLHYEMARKLIEGGFHVVCEKPVTTTTAEAMGLESLLEARKLIFAVAYTYTGYPMVRQMRAMIENGAIGRIHRVDVQYYQGWINTVIHDVASRAGVWRLDPKRGGQSCCLGDIGVHAFNLLEYTTGLRVERVLADINTLYPDNALDVDASVLVQMDSGAKGVVRTSQIATGEENNLQLAVYGRTGGLKWAQEEPNQLEFLQEDKPLTVFKAGHSFNLPPAREASKLPPGHPEGLIDAMGNIYKGVARAINGLPGDAGDYPGISAGVRAMRFMEAALASARAGGGWIPL